MSKEPIRFELNGAKEIDKILSQLPVKMQAKILASINREGAKIVQAEMKKNAPVGNDVIHNNIKIKKDKENLTGVTVGVTSKGFVARFIEYGTVLRTTKKGFQRGAMRPKPFIKRSIDNKIKEVISHITDNYAALVQKYLTKEVKKINKTK